MRVGNKATGPSRTRTRSVVPKFALYGERDAGSMMLHIESVQERSRLYHWDINPHLHSSLYQLVFVLSGPVRISLDAERYEGATPVVTLVPPGVVHAFGFGPDTEGYVLTLNTRWPSEGDMEMAEACRVLFAQPRILPLVATINASPRIDKLLLELMNEFRQPDGPRSPVTGWLARSVIWRLARWPELAHGEAAAVTPLQNDLFTRFRMLVEAHFTEHWEVARYAGVLGLTADRLNRICRQQANTSAFEIIQDRLLREACRRLIYVVVPVSQLAHELGFADPGYFGRFFKRRTNLSPNQYRKRHSGYELNG
jgi:AraC family transcriptional regulator, transcriptional activator of pobA